MKKFIKVIYLISYFLFNGILSNAQGWKAQSCNTCCWAAATENVFKRIGLGSIDECILLKQARITGYPIDCITPPNENFDQSKENYIGFVRRFSSFSYLKSTQNTLSWSFLTSILNSPNATPIVVSFDHNGTNNHFVNIYKTQGIANKQWLYVFDPYLTRKGVHYLKNYQTYQLPGKEMQCTYWGFGQEKVSDIFKTAEVVGNSSVLTIYSDTTNIKVTINSILNNSNRGVMPENVTGLKVGEILIPIDMASMTPLLNIKKDSSIIAQSTIVQDKTNSFIIPIFKDSSNKLVFVSMVILTKRINSNQFVIDRIQKLKAKTTLSGSDFTRNRDGSIRLSKKLLSELEFNMTEDGSIYMKLGNSYYNLSYDDSNPMSKSQFLGAITNGNPEAITNGNPEAITNGNQEAITNGNQGEYKSITSVNRSISKLNEFAFSQKLIDMGLSVQGNQLKVNGRTIKIRDFQTQLKGLKNVQNVIIMERAN
jgi:hypothetical protein